MTVPSPVRSAARRPGGAGQRAHTLERAQLVPRPVNEVFAFFAQARNLERITPPWLHFNLRTPGPLGAVPHTAIVRSDLDEIFDYRRDAVARILG